MASTMFKPTLTLTVNNAKTALEAGLQAIEGGQMEIDLGGLTVVDSAAVATLLEWKRAAYKKGQSLTFRNLPASVVFPDCTALPNCSILRNSKWPAIVPTCCTIDRPIASAGHSTPPVRPAACLIAFPAGFRKSPIIEGFPARLPVAAMPHSHGRHPDHRRRKEL